MHLHFSSSLTFISLLRDEVTSFTVQTESACVSSEMPLVPETCLWRVYSFLSFILSVKVTWNPEISQSPCSLKQASLKRRMELSSGLLQGRDNGRQSGEKKWGTCLRDEPGDGKIIGSPQWLLEGSPPQSRCLPSAHHSVHQYHPACHFVLN